MTEKLSKEQAEVLFERLVSLKCDSQWLFEDCVSRLALIDEGDSLTLVSARLRKLVDSISRIANSISLVSAFADGLDVRIKRNQDDEV